MQKIMFLEGHWIKAGGGRAVAEHIDGSVFLGISLRNVGSGIAVCQGWAIKAEQGSPASFPTHAPEEEFHSQSRDLYISAGDIGMWQGAMRNPDDPLRKEVAQAIDAHLGRGGQTVAHIVDETVERRGQIRHVGRDVGTRGIDEPHARRQRLIRLAPDVVAHRVDEEHGIFDGIARLRLVALEAH